MDQRLIFKTREFLILLDGEKLSQKALKVKRELEKMIPNDDYEAMDLCGEKLIKEVRYKDFLFFNKKSSPQFDLTS